jgi:hypothetical protein
MMAGAIIVVASLPFAYVSASAGGITRSVNQLSSAAIWPVAISAFAFARGLATVRPVSFRTSLPILSGAFIVWAAYDRWTWIAEARQAAVAHPGVAVAPAIGFWIFCLGGALIVVGSVILQFVKPHRT